METRSALPLSPTRIAGEAACVISRATVSGAYHTQCHPRKWRLPDGVIVPVVQWLKQAEEKREAQRKLNDQRDTVRRDRRNLIVVLRLL